MTNSLWTDTAVIQDILEIPMKKIRWLWEDRFRANSLNLISGQRDGGKSTLLIELAFKILCGGTWPLLPDQPIETGSVIYMATEDTLAEDTRPKIEAIFQDSEKRPLDGNKFLTITKIVRDSEDEKLAGEILLRDWGQHKKTLETMIDKVGNVRLILLDPIISFSGSIKGNDEIASRNYLEMLLKFAQEKKVTIIGTRHVNKDEKQSAEQRTMGSSSWQDVPRAVWMLARHPDDAHLEDPQQIRRTLTKSKCNGAIRPTNLLFKLRSVSIFKDGKPDRGLPVCDFDTKPLKMTANEVFDNDSRKRKAEKFDVASNWLLDKLDDGPQTVEWLKKEAKLDKVAWRTVERAAEKLGISDKDDQEHSSKGTFLGTKWKQPD